MTKYRIDPTAGLLVTLILPVWLTWDVITAHRDHWTAIPIAFGVVGVGYIYFYYLSYIQIDHSLLKFVSIFTTKKIPIKGIAKLEKLDTPTLRLIVITYRDNGKVKTAKFRYNAYPEATLKKLVDDLTALNPTIRVGKM